MLPKDWDYVPADMTIEGNNQCQLSEEEAREVAEKYMETLGLDYPVLTSSHQNVWSKGEDSRDGTLYGYSFTFDFGVDELSFLDFGLEGQYDNYTLSRKESEPRWYSLDTSIDVSVTDQGVIWVGITNPVETVGITENVALLPLDAIEGIMKDALQEDVEQFRFYDYPKEGISFNHMELIYFRVRNKEKEGSYSYLPAWRLSYLSGKITLGRELGVGINCLIEHPVLVNAIDGTIINLLEEL